MMRLNEEQLLGKSCHELIFCMITISGNQLGVAIENITFYYKIKYLKEFNEDILEQLKVEGTGDEQAGSMEI